MFKVLLTTAFAAAIVAACGIQNKPDDNDFVVVSDPAKLANRITKMSKDMAIDEGADGSSSTTLGLHRNNRLNISYSLRLIGELEAPLLDGHILQATDIYSDGGYAYVSYNFADDPKRGAIEVLDISEEDDPVVISQLLYRNSDINAIALSNGHLYAVGSDNNSQPAFLRKFRLDHDDNSFTGDVQTARLSSHAGNDVAVYGNTVAVTTGSDGHLSFLKADDLSNISSIQQNNLRSVNFDRRNGTAWALKGENASSLHYNSEGTKQSNPIVFGGANQDQAKSTINVGRKTLLTALNEEGVKIICKANGRLLAHVPVNNPDGLDETKAVTNSAAMHEGFLFTANGEAGVSLYVSRSASWNGCGNRTLVKQGRVDFGSGFSANHVFYSRGFVFVADGTGGVKILRLIRDSNCDSPDNDSDQDEDDSDDVTICYRGQQTRSVSRTGVRAYLRRGATLGACR